MRWWTRRVIRIMWCFLTSAWQTICWFFCCGLWDYEDFTSISTFVVCCSLFVVQMFNSLTTRAQGSHKVHESVFSVSNYTFMNLNLLLRHPTYSSLYDLYVYKLNATDEMLGKMTNEMENYKSYKDNVMLPYVSMTNET